MMKNSNQLTDADIARMTPEQAHEVLLADARLLRGCPDQTDPWGVNAHLVASENKDGPIVALVIVSVHARGPRAPVVLRMMPTLHGSRLRKLMKSCLKYSAHFNEAWIRKMMDGQRHVWETKH